MTRIEVRGEPSVILEGVQSEASESLLYSTVHGAGRVMSRTQAAGKVKRRKVWECNQRNCSCRAPHGRHLPGGHAAVDDDLAPAGALRPLVCLD